LRSDGSVDSSFAFLFHPPSARASIEAFRLSSEWALISLTTLGVFVALRDSKGSDRQDKTEPVPPNRAKRQLPVLPLIVILGVVVLGLGILSLRRLNRNLSSGEVSKVTGLASVTNYGAIELNAYNGSSSVLSETTVAISVLDSNRRPLISDRAYRLWPSTDLHPQSSGRCSANLGFYLQQDQTWSFTIVGVKGRPE
jgi:hypothetical protein